MHRRITFASLFVVLVLALAACAPITLTPTLAPGTQVAPTPPATSASATAAVTAAATASTTSETPPASGQGKLFAGTVKHAGQPVPGARVELRELGWATDRTPAVATVQADAQGAFNLANPPAGDFSVIGLFPDGEIDAGGWPPVSIAPGQEITGFVVPLERRLTLLSPIAGAPTSAAPMLSWRTSDEAARYRVWLIDAGTTELLLDQTTTGAGLLVPKSLEPGVYQWVVNGLNNTGEVVATGEETFAVSGPGGESTVAPATPGEVDEAAGLPPSCQPRAGETAVYSDREHGFCFLYPASFEKDAFDPGQINVVGVVAGPPLDSSPDPLRATLLIEVVPASSPDLEAAVGDIMRAFEGQAGVTIKQTSIDLGGTPAVLLQGVPGRGGSRDVVTVQNGLRYRFLFMPEPQGFPQVARDFQALFDAVTQSMTFLPPEAAAGQATPTGAGMPRLPDRDRAFEGAREALAKRLGVDPLSIQRVDVTPVEWRDACLGVTSGGQMCAQVITPGWVVVLEANGQRYEAHTDQEGVRVRFVGLQ